MAKIARSQFGFTNLYADFDMVYETEEEGYLKCGGRCIPIAEQYATWVDNKITDESTSNIFTVAELRTVITKLSEESAQK